MIGEKELKKLAEIIVRNLQKEFEIKHLSGNLINTIKIEYMFGEIRINIPAQTYNMLLYMQKGVVVHTSHGSYASRLDKQGSSFMVYPNNTRAGSFRKSPGNHKGYIDRIINASIQEWEKNITGLTPVKIEG